MNEEDKLILGTLAGIDLVLSPEHYEEYKGTLNKQLEQKDKEIERLNNIINKAIHYINLNQDEKTLCLNYNQLKALRGILKQDDFYLKIFEEQLKELKEGR